MKEIKQNLNTKNIWEGHKLDMIQVTEEHQQGAFLDGTHKIGCMLQKYGIKTVFTTLSTV